jgi:hypothetical protein
MTIKSKDDEISRAHSMHKRDKKCIQILVGITEGKRPFRRPRHTLEDNIKTDIRQISLSVVDWINLAQDRDQQQALLNMVITLQLP